MLIAKFYIDNCINPGEPKSFKMWMTGNARGVESDCELEDGEEDASSAGNCAACTTTVTNGSLWPLGLAGSPIALRNKVTNSPVASANLVLFLAFKWLEKSPREQARPRRVGTTAAYSWRCWHHVD